MLTDVIITNNTVVVQHTDSRRFTRSQGQIRNIYNSFGGNVQAIVDFVGPLIEAEVGIPADEIWFEFDESGNLTNIELGPAEMYGR